MKVVLKFSKKHWIWRGFRTFDKKAIGLLVPNVITFDCFEISTQNVAQGSWNDCEQSQTWFYAQSQIRSNNQHVKQESRSVKYLSKCY